MSSEADLSLCDVTSFVRHLTHDVRNHLNGLELEVVLIEDSITDPEVLESLKRMRGQLRNLADTLRTVSSRFIEPSPNKARISAMDLFLIFQEQTADIDNVPAINWAHTLKEEHIEVDAGDMASALKELVVNAMHFGTGEPLKIEAQAVDGRVSYVLHEPKTAPVDTEEWGRSPFQTTRRAGYGLGLWDTHRMVAASGGRLIHQYEPATRELFSTLSFPISG